METKPENDIPTNGPPQEIPASLPEPGVSQSGQADSDQRKVIIAVVVCLIVFLAVTIVSVIFLARADVGEVARIRDIFIIFLAVQSLFIGIVLVILLIQLAQLLNLLKNEVKPILESTNQTVSTLRGTTNFLSNNLVEPVIKLNEYMAGMSTFLQTVGLIKRSSKKNPHKGD
jgi:hypothetical protein